MNTLKIKWKHEHLKLGGSVKNSPLNTRPRGKCITYPTWATAHLYKSGRWFTHAPTRRPPFDAPFIAILENKNIQFEKNKNMYTILHN